MQEPFFGKCWTRAMLIEPKMRRRSDEPGWLRRKKKMEPRDWEDEGRNWSAAQICWWKWNSGQGGGWGSVHQNSGGCVKYPWRAVGRRLPSDRKSDGQALPWELQPETRKQVSHIPRKENCGAQTSISDYSWLRELTQRTITVELSAQKSIHLRLNTNNWLSTPNILRSQNYIKTPFRNLPLTSFVSQLFLSHRRH